MSRYILRIFLPAVMSLSLMSGCGTAPDRRSSAPQGTASPPLHEIADGMILVIARPFEVPNQTVLFVRGRIQDWFNVTSWNVRCKVHFETDPGGRVLGGRYRVIKARQATVPAGDDYEEVTTLLLERLRGPEIDYIMCSHRGSYGESSAPGPVTLQEFRHALGRYFLVERLP